MSAFLSPVPAAPEVLRAALSNPVRCPAGGDEDRCLDPVELAIADIAAGRPVVVVDDEDRENEGDLVIAAEHATPEIVAFMMSECRGLMCAPMEGEELDRLQLPQMVQDNTESMKTAFTISVDACAAHSVSTGISAADRATTLQLLASGTAGPSDFVRPGHVFPLRARPGGVLVRNGHTEAAVDLARLAGLRPAGAIVEIAGEDGRMLRLPELIPFARKHGLTIISIEDLIA
ncbi:3,4-dihydroxy-2-butanone-4-phosphate synthase, partial [Streptomyces sp. NPDC058467]